MPDEIKPALTPEEWATGRQSPALGSWVEAQCKPMSSGERLFVLRGIAFGEQRTIVGEERLPGSGSI